MAAQPQTEAPVFSLARHLTIRLETTQRLLLCRLLRLHCGMLEHTFEGIKLMGGVGWGVRPLLRLM